MARMTAEDFIGEAQDRLDFYTEQGATFMVQVWTDEVAIRKRIVAGESGGHAGTVN